jgi:Rieske 2Fe-2S family protein
MASGDFTAEDIYACEQQQKSLASPYLEIGPAAAGESPITSHQKAILNFMDSGKDSK